MVINYEPDVDVINDSYVFVTGTTDDIVVIFYDSTCIMLKSRAIYRSWGRRCFDDAMNRFHKKHVNIIQSLPCE